MPTYRYQCKECKKVFDDLVSIEDRLLGGSCPNCEGRGDYLISAPHIAAHIESDKWVKNRESHMKQERKNMRDHGTYK